MRMVLIILIAGIVSGGDGSCGTSAPVHLRIRHARVGSGQFYSPWGIRMDGSGNVYVTDRINENVQKFSSSGSYLGGFGSSGWHAGEFNSRSA